MQIAKNEALSKVNNAALLPPSLEALTVLARLDADVIQTGIDQGEIRADLTIADAKAFAQRSRGLVPIEKPFDYSARLRCLVDKVDTAVDQVPADHRGRFASDLVQELKGLASIWAEPQTSRRPRSSEEPLCSS